MKTLIVDDDFANRKMMQQRFNRYGQTHLASNGKQAIEIFTEALKTDEPFDLICLDIAMPVMDGHETLKEFRRIEEVLRVDAVRAANILMITAMADRDNVVQAIGNNCQGYLVKPLDMKRLKNELLCLNLIDDDQQ